jgi:hypothetical protein
MSYANNKEQNMATSVHAVKSQTAAKKRSKTAEELLSAKMGDLVDRAALHMNDKEFEQAHKRSLDIISRVRASRRGTK